MKKTAVVKSLLFAVVLLWAGVSHAQVYRKPIPSLPLSFDPKHYSDAYSVLVSTQIYDRLFDFDDFQNIKPSIAEKWETTEGGRVWTITLKQNVRFHDGKTLTAEDVEFSLYRLLDPESIKSRELSIIAGTDEYIKKRAKTVSGIKIIALNVIRIELKSPFPPFLALLSAVNTEILPKNFSGQTEVNFFKHPIGTGPFKMESFEPERRVTLTRNDDYFLGKPYLEKIIFEKTDTAGAIDGFNHGYYHDLEMYADFDLRRVTVAYTMIKAPIPEVSILAFNERRPPFNNAHVRRAMLYALDRKRLVDECFPGRKLAVGYIPPGVGGYYPEIQPTPFDLVKAKEELRASAISPGELSRSVTLLRPDNHPCIEGFAKFIESSWRKIGMNVGVKYMPLSELYTRYYAPKSFDLVNLIYSADYPEGLFLLNYYRSDHPHNFTGFKSKALDDLLAKAEKAEDRYDRYNLYRKAQEILQQDVAIIPLFYDTYEGIYQKYVRGIERSPYISYTTPMRLIRFDQESMPPQT